MRPARVYRGTVLHRSVVPPSRSAAPSVSARRRFCYTPRHGIHPATRVLRHARFSAEVRGFFRSQGYAEVDTPVLRPYLIPEPAIEVFQTEYLPARGAARPMWLAPSPELWMKRLLAAGSGDIFQVSRSFRNGDFGGPHHNPEFRLLEWYTVGAGYLRVHRGHRGALRPPAGALAPARPTGASSPLPFSV